MSVPLVHVIRDQVTRARFDNATDTWTVTTADGRTECARTVVDARRSDEPTIAAHGIPNYFRTPGPDVARQTRMVKRCLDLLTRSGATRIEAKSRIILHRRYPWPPKPLPSRFYLTGSAPDADIFDGAARLVVNGREIAVHARLAGHLDPIDGRFHWRGTISGLAPLDLPTGQRGAEISIGGPAGPARIVERTPWGHYTVAGVGELHATGD